MKRQPTTLIIAHTLAIALLLFNGAGAVYGGCALILVPDGRLMGMDTMLLKHSPFHDFLIPGIILFVFNGLSSLSVMVLALLRARNYYHYILCQGVVLLGWLIIQILMIRNINVLHLIMGITGAAMVICSILIANRYNNLSNKQ